MAEVKRALAHHEDEFSTLLQADIRCTQQKVGRNACGNGAHALNGAGSNNHAMSNEGTAGQAGANVLQRVPETRESLEIGGGAARFEVGSALPGAAQNQVGFNPGLGVQFFKQPVPVNGAASTGDTDDYSQISSSDRTHAFRKRNTLAGNAIIFSLTRFSASGGSPLRPAGGLGPAS